MKSCRWSTDEKGWTGEAICIAHHNRQRELFPAYSLTNNRSRFCTSKSIDNFCSWIYSFRKRYICFPLDANRVHLLKTEVCMLYIQIQKRKTRLQRNIWIGFFHIFSLARKYMAALPLVCACRGIKLCFFHFIFVDMRKISWIGSTILLGWWDRDGKTN